MSQLKEKIESRRFFYLVYDCRYIDFSYCLYWSFDEEEEKKKKKVKVKVTKMLLLQMVNKWELQNKNGFLPKAKKSITFFFLTWFVVFIGPSLRRRKHSSRIFEWTTYSSILPTWVATTLELRPTSKRPRADCGRSFKLRTPS